MSSAVSLYSMLSAVSAHNAAQMSMLCASDRMLNQTGAVSFGNSQPLKPSLAAASHDELMLKASETQVSVLNHLISALEKGAARSVKNSAPKYTGISYKA